MPDLTGTSVRGARSALTDRRLELGEITDAASDEPKGNILRQSPPPGTQVVPGTRVTVVVSRGEMPQQAYRLHLTSRTARVKPGEEVELIAEIRPPPGRTRVSYGFTVNGRSVSTNKQSRRLRHRFLEPGRYEIRASARIGREGTLVDSNLVSIRVEQPPPRPQPALKALVSPPRHSVERGAAVEFRGSALNARGPLSYRWEGPAGTRDGPTYRVETERLKEGAHPVRLLVSNGRRTARASAALEVLAASEPTPPLRVQIRPKEVTVLLGEEVTFDAEASDSDVPLDYRWEGPNGLTGPGRRFTVVTSGLEPRAYRIALTVSNPDRGSASDRASLEVTAVPVPEPRLTLSANRSEIDPGDLVSFRGSLEPDPGGASLSLVMNGEIIASSLSPGQPVPHRFSGAGTYRLWLTADIAGTPLRSNWVEIRVKGIAAPEPPPPAAPHALPMAWLLLGLCAVGVAALLAALGVKRWRGQTRGKDLAISARVQRRWNRSESVANPGEVDGPGLTLALVLDRGSQSLGEERSH